MKRVPTCIGLDPDVKSYLDTREQRTNTEFINCLIRAYKDQENIRLSVGDIEKKRENPISLELVDGIVDSLEESSSTCEEKIRGVITEKPYRWIIPIKNGKIRVDNKLISDIENQTLWIDCNAKPTKHSIRKILKEEVEKFNMESVKKNDT